MHKCVQAQITNLESQIECTEMALLNPNEAALNDSKTSLVAPPIMKSTVAIDMAALDLVALTDDEQM